MSLPRLNTHGLFWATGCSGHIIHELVTRRAREAMLFQETLLYQRGNEAPGKEGQQRSDENRAWAWEVGHLGTHRAPSLPGPQLSRL